MTKKYKFTKLNNRAKHKAAFDYLSGWLETHPKDSLSVKECMKLCLDINNDVRYNSKGEIYDS